VLRTANFLTPIDQKTSLSFIQKVKILDSRDGHDSHDSTTWQFDSKILNRSVHGDDWREGCLALKVCTSVFLRL
jgi:hypothetical protein